MDADRSTDSVWSCRLAAAVLILGSAALRVFYLAHDCPLDLAPDEAHYWDWSRHLDWSYYSKGPLVALLIRAACELFGPWSRALTGTDMLAVRMPAVVCGSLLLAAMYVLTVQVYRREKLALGVVAVGLTLPLMAAGSSLMTIDAPFTCCWGWALVFGFRALFRGSWWAWPAAGVCVLLGVLAKHTMVLWVPCLGLFFLFTPAFRPLLVDRRFWLLTGIGALGGLPILLWNVANGWVTLEHTRGHAGLDEPGAVHWLGPLRYLAIQFLVLLGFWFIAWARAVWTHRPWREERPEVAYLWWMSVPLIAFFLAFSLKNGGGEPNWPIAGYLSGLVLTAGWLAEQLEAPRVWYRRLTLGGVLTFCAIGLGLSLAVHNTGWVQPALVRLAGPPTPERPTPLRRLDPTCRLRGWRTLAAEVDRLRDELRAGGDEPVLVGTVWNLPGELGFYCDGQPAVYSIGLALGDRHSQYDLWRPNPVADVGQFAGKTFLVVGVDAAALKAAFAEVGPTRLITYTEAGQPIAAWPVTVARGYRGFRMAADAPAY